VKKYRVSRFIEAEWTQFKLSRMFFDCRPFFFLFHFWSKFRPRSKTTPRCVLRRIPPFRSWEMRLFAAWFFLFSLFLIIGLLHPQTWYLYALVLLDQTEKRDVSYWADISLLMSLEEPQGDVPSTLPFPIAFQINALVIFLPARKTQLECFFGSLVFICFYPAPMICRFFSSAAPFFYLLYNRQEWIKTRSLLASFWEKKISSQHGTDAIIEKREQNGRY
jgi:hypothetical protein